MALVAGSSLLALLGTKILLFGLANGPALPAVDSDGPLSNIYVMEEHQIAGRAWYQAAIEAKVKEPVPLLHWDTHDDMMNPFAGNLRLGLNNLTYRNPWAVRNDAFIVEAFVRGLISEVVRTSREALCSVKSFA
eukprot:SAG31_NODE_23958_length_492_cov_0.966921_1_plen_133_part_01